MNKKNIGLFSGDLMYRYFYLYRHCRVVQAKQGTKDFEPALLELKKSYYETTELNEKYKKMSMDKKVVCKYVEPTQYKQIIDKFVSELGIEPYQQKNNDLEF